MVTNNTAAAAVTFSDDWSSEEPTVVERQAPAPGRIADWHDHTGTWYALSDADLRRVFTLGDDPTVTHSELPAVAA